MILAAFLSATALAKCSVDRITAVPVNIIFLQSHEVTFTLLFANYSSHHAT